VQTHGQNLQNYLQQIAAPPLLKENETTKEFKHEWQTLINTFLLLPKKKQSKLQKITIHRDRLLRDVL